MINVLFFLLSTLNGPQTPLTTEETQQTYVDACTAYALTGNPATIAIDVGDRETQGLGTLACLDYAADVSAEITKRLRGF